MIDIKVRNVNEALPIAMGLFRGPNVINISPRGMETLELNQPVCTTYTNPTERVLLWKERDANPFFHLMESLWILAGRFDVAWLARFNKRMVEYSDDGERFHGAYGYRLRFSPTTTIDLGQVSGTKLDQIAMAVDFLKYDPDTRQCVLQIWNMHIDLARNSRDLPCNSIIFLKIRNNKLNITVCNRSNDVIWGAYGANVVQFSMLQEYIAGKLGIELGEYRQVSDSFHVYTDNPQWKILKDIPYMDFNPYKYDVKPYPIMQDAETWDNDLLKFMSVTEIDSNISPETIEYNNSFFKDVAVPMFKVWFMHKGNQAGLEYIEEVKAEDWRMAAMQWLEKREGAE